MHDFTAHDHAAVLLALQGAAEYIRTNEFRPIAAENMAVKMENMSDRYMTYVTAHDPNIRATDILQALVDSLRELN